MISKTTNALPLACALLVSFAAAPVNAQSEPAAAGAARVPPSNNGVIAEEVDGNVTINNNFARPFDVNRERVASMMSRYLQQGAAARAAVTENIAHFTVLQDSSDPVFRASQTSGTMFILLAGDYDDLDAIGLSGAPRCDFQYGYYMAGFALSGSISTRIEFSQEFLEVDQPLFAQLCDALGAEARGPGGPAASRNEVVTNFDVLSAGERIVAFTFIPAAPGGVDFETAVGRDFWLGAVSPVNPFQLPEAAQREFEREYGRTRVAEMQAEAGETGRLSGSIDLRRLGLGSSLVEQRQAAQRDFGQTFIDVEAGWRRFLVATPIANANGEPASYTADGVFPRRLPRFTVAAVGTPAFWARIGEVEEFQQTVTCAAVRFAVEQEYARSRDLPNYAECVASNIRSSRAQRR